MDVNHTAWCKSRSPANVMPGTRSTSRRSCRPLIGSLKEACLVFARPHPQELNCGGVRSANGWFPVVAASRRP